MLGEDLVVFRDSDGRLGVIDELCPHRRASLALGRNEECGLRCLYHGWKIDVDGNVLEMASEPADARFGEKMKHKAYPVQEAGGFVWVYMGPAEKMPAFDPPVFGADAGHAHHHRQDASSIATGRRCSKARSIPRIHRACIPPTWCRRRSTAPKATDNAWLRPSTDKAPRLQVQRTPLRLPLCRDPPADRQRSDPRCTCAPPCSSRRSPC